MYHQSQATKVHVVYCFFIARPVLLHVGMGYTNQTSHLFLKPELRYRNAILPDLSMGNWKPTEGQSLRIAICHNMQENFQRQLRHITNTYFTASIVSHNEPQYWDQMTKKTSLKKKTSSNPPGFSVYRRNSGPQRVRRHMSQLLRAPSKFVASFSPAFWFSSCKKGGIWKVELISQCYLWHCSIPLP